MRHCIEHMITSANLIKFLMRIHFPREREREREILFYV